MERNLVGSDEKNIRGETSAILDDIDYPDVVASDRECHEVGAAQIREIELRLLQPQRSRAPGFRVRDRPAHGGASVAPTGPGAEP
jgi:hypothetical protein